MRIDDFITDDAMRYQSNHGYQFEKIPFLVLTSIDN